MRRLKWPGAGAPQRLSTRIVAVFLGLLLLVQAAGFGAIGVSIEDNARATLARELAVGERLWLRLIEQKAGSLEQGAKVLAADFGFRSALSSGDDETLSSALENNAGRIAASIAAFVDPAMQVRAAFDAAGAGADSATLGRVAGQLAGQLAARKAGSVVALYAGQPTQFVAVPVKTPLPIGWVLMGFPIDQALVDDMRRLSELDVALLRTGADGGTTVGVSTLGEAARDAALASADRAVIGGDAKVARRVVLSAEDGGTVVLLRSVADAVAPFRALQWQLLAITLVAVAVFAVGSVFTARWVTTPLRALVRASERLGRGDYAQAMAHAERRDEIGELAKAFDHMRVNIAERTEEVERLAYWDRLTGLPNRAQFRQAAHRAMAGAGPCAVLLLGLNRFKHVNDALGYAFGDRVLEVVGQRLAGAAEPGSDLVARLGGDAFALLLPGADAERARDVAARVEAAFEAPVRLDDQTVDIAAAFGIACWPAHGSDADELLNRAEIAMYAAKKKAASVIVYDPAIDARSAFTLSLLSELRRALEHDELRLFLQPKIELASGRLTGAEALVRWQHPARGMVPPMQFIPFAEQTGFVRQLTLWVFEATVSQWPALQALGVQRVSVNLSTRDLMDSELPAKLNAILRQHGMAATAFCLEITESAIMDEPERAKATLDALSAAGFELSIDDFGTGFSSLAYLKSLPVDELKIDKGFVMGMERNAGDATIVRSTIDLAHNLGLTVVAEGVENAATLQQLRALGCDAAQGYHMSKPVPAAELAAFAQHWAARRGETAPAAP
jgi:diguanylate cyclase (GGDEF)-like protein